MDEVLVEQKVTAILGDCCSYEGENEYDIGHKVGKKNFLKVLQLGYQLVQRFDDADKV